MPAHVRVLTLAAVAVEPRSSKSTRRCDERDVWSRPVVAAQGIMCSTSMRSAAVTMDPWTAVLRAPRLSPRAEGRGRTLASLPKGWLVEPGGPSPRCPGRVACALGGTVSLVARSIGHQGSTAGPRGTTQCRRGSRAQGPPYLCERLRLRVECISASYSKSRKIRCWPGRITSEMSPERRRSAR